MGRDFIVMLPFCHQNPLCGLYYLQLQGSSLPQAMRMVRYIFPIFLIDHVLDF